jgi:hypothetical protein
MDEIIITEENFSQYFRDAANTRPEPGECLAVFRAIAELVDGNLKQDVINKLQENKVGCQNSIQILMKHAGMDYKEALRVCKEITADLIEFDCSHVLNKPYKFLYENRYFTKKEHVPKDSPNWYVVGLKNIDVSNFMKHVQN